MRRFLLGLWIVVLTLALILGGGMLLSGREREKRSLEETTQTTVPETTCAVTETTVVTLPPETEPMETQTLPTGTQPETLTVDSVPLYYQTDYPYVKFGNGTIATSGCSVTCLAMVSTWMTDQEYTPLQMAHHFGSYGKTNIERLDHGIAQMQLPYTRTENIQEVLRAVKDGKAAIVMMDDESVFTTEQHFIVLAGLNENGKFIVNDPLETNYINADVALKHCYENGFDDFYLMRGFSGGWIFDKADMPEDPFLFDASMPEQQTNRYNGYLLPEEDIYMLACFVWAEAGKESLEVQQAVAEVVLNRLVSPEYPNTVRDVIYQTEFYRSAKTMQKWKENNYIPYMAVDAAMYGPYILPEDVCFYSAWETGKEVWGQLGPFTFAKKR